MSSYQRCSHPVLALAAVALSAGCGGVGPKVEDYKQYDLQTNFNVQSDFDEESTVGKVLNMLKDFGDEPEDPGKFIVQTLIDYLPTPLDAAARPLSDPLGGLVNQLIYQLIPTIADEVKGFSQGVANIVRVFEVESVLDVGLDANGNYTASHRLTKVTFAFMDLQLVLEGAELGPVAVPDCIAVEIEDGTMKIEEHEMPLPVGSIAVKGINTLVLPAIGGSCPECLTYVALVDHWLSCSTISSAIAKEIDTEAATPLVEAACNEASHGLSGKVTEMIADLDRNGGFKLKGSATVSGDAATVSGAWKGEYRLTEKVKADLESNSAPFVGEVIAAAR